MKQKIIYFFLSIIVLTSCGEYNQILRSTDYNMKYQYAKKCFEEKKYNRTITILEDIVTSFKGLEEGEEALYLLAQSFYLTKDYFSATELYNAYLNSYPNGTFAEEALYYSAYGLFLDSPDVRLDQSKTYKAIVQAQKYLDKYPQSDRAETMTEIMFGLQEKLALKELLAAKLYLKLGNYMGNNYESCIITIREAKKSYPYSSYSEEMQIVMLRAYNEMAIRSYVEKLAERNRIVIDEYYNYKNSYPEGKYLKEAEKYYNNAQKVLDRIPN